ncbi:pentapeptide repeat-containing protein [Actinophytocola oryzae]|uniref:Pentapeptide repeat protein n=1 Tax=Actinophytocola oryzae TaxID=502181 RepID=A0A4R7VBI2_9PSEU|nr:pentapeptide repeat-containing protein [Actinophytocola oryzae]TDV46289.1 pentapeptide repeat protein [Actinophytocola oryzae]
MARFEDRFPPLPGHPPRLEQPSATAWRGSTVRVALGVAAAVVVVFAALFLPRLLLDWDLAGATTPDRARAVNDVRAGVLQAVGGLVVVIGAALTWRQVQVSRAGQVTDAFAGAITHLGDPEESVRLGGIYALERIARTSRADRQAVDEVLCLFVKRRAVTGQRETDVNVALLVLGRRAGRTPLVLDRVQAPDVRLRFARLAGTDLHFADLSSAVLFGADLAGADMSGVNLRAATLIDASLHQADLRDADLAGVLASNVDLRAADLSRADLTGAHLDRARLEQADLRGALLTGAELDGATLAGAVVDDDTAWPEGFTPAGVVRTDLPLRPRTYGEAT